MRIIEFEEIQAVIALPDAIDAVRQAFIDYSKGLIEQPQPLQILFKQDSGELFGDCHAKAAQNHQLPYFVIKIATGFYNNPSLGLEPNSGLVLVMSSKTGQPIAILQDDGWLTQVRTAAAGALAASLKPVSADACLGILGTGTQAYLQAKLITQFLGLQRVAIWGRNVQASEALSQRLSDELGLDVVAMQTVREVCHVSQILVTTTPATEPLIKAEDLADELHIVAVGADSPGKNEIASSVLARADIIVTDSHQQCLHHGDFGEAVRADVVAEDADVSFGEVLAGEHPNLDFMASKISVVDLTGLGAQDLAIVSLVVDV